MTKIHANIGVPRNKKPLKNKVYEITFLAPHELRESTPDKIMQYQKYMFKDIGYLILHWWYDAKNTPKNWHGFITPEELKQKIGVKQYAKFCGEGKRIFIIQRRVNGKNIPKNK